MAINPNIPLQAQGTRFAPTLSNLIQNRNQMERQDRLDQQGAQVAQSQIASNNALTEQRQSQTAMQERAARAPSQEVIDQVRVASAFDARAVRNLLERAQDPNINDLQRKTFLDDAARLALVASDRLRGVGDGNSPFNEFLLRGTNLITENPGEAYKFFDETFVPMLKLNKWVAEEEQPEQFETRTLPDGTQVQVDLSSNREFPSPRNAAQPETVVNVNTQGESAATKRFGENIGERAGERVDMAEEAIDQNVLLDRVSLALERGAGTGTGEETFLNLKGIGENIFGMDFEGVPEQEVIRTIQNQMALRLRNPDSGMGLPGSTSNRDLQFLKDSVVGLARSEEGNELLIDFMKRQNNMKVDVVAEQNRIINENNGVVPSDLDSRIMEYVNDYDFFTPEERTQLQLSAEQSGEYDLPEVTTQEEYDALPSGSVYLEDGQRMVKP